MRVLSLILLIAVLLVSPWFLSGNKQASIDHEDKPVENQSVNEATTIPIASSATSPDISTELDPVQANALAIEENKPCWTADAKAEFFSSQKMIIVNEWVAQLGVFVPVYMDETREQYQQQHPYEGYDKEVIETLAEQNDALALHTLGLMARYKAFNQPLPDQSIKLFDNSTFDLDTQSPVNMQAFQESQDLLFRAAASGRIEALTEIAFNYFYFELWSKVNDRSPEFIETYRLHKLAFEKLRKRIIPVLPTQFSATSDDSPALIDLIDELEAEYDELLVQQNSFRPRPPDEFLEYMEFYNNPKCE